jgi:hypothetical protein
MLITDAAPHLQVHPGTSPFQRLQALNHITGSLCSLGLVNQAAVRLPARKQDGTGRKQKEAMSSQSTFACKFLAGHVVPRQGA